MSAEREIPERIGEPLEAQLRECFGRVAYSHKTHEKSADLFQRRLHRLKTAQIALSAITTTGLLTTIFARPGISEYAAALSAIFSTAVLALATYTKEFDLGSRSQAHREAAARLWFIRERYASLLADAKSGAVDPSAARRLRDELMAELATAYRSAPHTFPRAYREAQKALQVQEELTFSDEEIDALLPPPLRRSTQA